MTPNEIQALIVGLAIGGHSVNVLHIVLNQRDTRRDRAAARQAWRNAAGDHYLQSLRLYQLKNRSRAW